ncbi:Tetratricopeptide repeat (TPR)-like superfamily protein [Striga hermonthica]|uniref:Tetratricopeptide repeat (TPR)-like superfamily protein n=1 Tax=Striga hermonthica TaxID=68872 RepID=A0A9N7NAN8_STRHE|nr:Tetratricopeptide repeat (TPR)-like superfamily protein [Striga hermonthica]
MPGLVSVKTPPDAAPLRITVPDESPIRQVVETIRSEPKSSSPATRRPPASSPSTSRAKPSPDRGSARKKSSPEKSLLNESSLDNPDLGPFLLKLARDTIASGEGPSKALDYALRASRSFEKCATEGEPSLDLSMSLHVVAAIYCSLGKFEEAVPVLERAIKVPEVQRGADHALAVFSGYMQLGDTHSMLGHLDRSINCYEEGLKVQMEALGENDPRVAETCRYLAEAHVQAMQFEEAERLCKKTLEIHRVHSPPASLEEATDRRLMALICEAKSDHESALEHLVLASMAMIAHGHEAEVAAIDVCIGNIYSALTRFDEAVFSYQKALTVFKSSRGDHHPSVASVFTRLAELYHKTGKLRESRSYCENALRIYAKPVPGTLPEDIATGLTEISAIYEMFNEPDETLKLLHKAMKLLEDKPGQLATVAGIEARLGVMLYMVGRYEESRASFASAIEKLRGYGERSSAFFGVVLNQMGLACVQLFRIDEAAGLFEEARAILEKECGPCHHDTLGVYSNLAATYDAMGRIEDAIEILEYVLKLREEKLGTANPDFDDEKKRLAELLKEAGRSRNKKAKSLENLIDPNSKRTHKKETSSKKWSAFAHCRALIPVVRGIVRVGSPRVALCTPRALARRTRRVFAMFASVRHANLHSLAHSSLAILCACSPPVVLSRAPFDPLVVHSASPLCIRLRDPFALRVSVTRPYASSSRTPHYPSNVYRRHTLRAIVTHPRDQRYASSSYALSSSSEGADSPVDDPGVGSLDGLRPRHRSFANSVAKD